MFFSAVRVSGTNRSLKSIPSEKRVPPLQLNKRVSIFLLNYTLKNHGAFERVSAAVQCFLEKVCCPCNELPL